LKGKHWKEEEGQKTENNKRPAPEEEKVQDSHIHPC